MAFTVYRFARAVRSMCAPMTAIIGFSFLLTWIFILYQPSHGPGLAQRLEWQSWDMVVLGLDDNNRPATQTGGGAGETLEEGVPPSEDVPHGVDWWNVTTSQDAKPFDSTSLPLDVWAPLLPHDTGLTELTIKSCVVDPELAGKVCAPHSTSEEDAKKGKWVRVDRDLNRQKGFWWLHLYYRRTRRQDVPLITEMRILEDKVLPYASGSKDSESWHKVDKSVRDGTRLKPMYLWYKTGKSMGEMTKEEKKGGAYVMEVDVLYGEDRPWYGFERMKEAVSPEEEGRAESVWFTYRKSVQVAPKAPPLHFSHSGRFKILQVADLHFSVSFGNCRDTSLSPCKHSDNLTSTLLSRVLASEKPDLVIFTGDQLNGQGTSWDPRSVLAKFATAVTDAKIPWAAVFGNHDEEEVDLKKNGKEEQVKMMQALPYSLVERGPKDVHGVGNYVLRVKSADASKMDLLTLYFLDSGSYSKGVLDWFGFWRPTEYDYIRQNQINWFLQESSKINAIERPFTPDGSKDLGDIWARQSPDQVLPQTKKLAKPNALMFFHIPLPEAYGPADKDPRTGDLLDVGTSGQEEPGAGKKNEGFFEKGLLQAKESNHVNDKEGLEVKVVANGHCHLTENCKRVKGVWMCFGGGGSYSGYGKVGFDRRFRIYDVSNYGETIRTYKRTENDEIVDDIFLVGGSAPPFPLT